MLARDIMTRNPAVVTPGESIAHAAEIMREKNIGIIPVVNDRTHMRLEGLITDRDIAVRCVAERHDPSCRVMDHMTTDHLDTVRADTSVDDVMRAMRHDRVRRIPVVEEGERLVGIIAQADLALHVGPLEPEKVESVLQQISEPTRSAPVASASRPVGAPPTPPA